MSKVLVVDDSISVRKALERILSMHGYEPVSAEHAAAALQYLSYALPDLIITDVVMPEVDGFELSRQIKAQPRLAHLPIILISGIVNPEVEQQALQVGAVGVVKKPFKSEDLLPSIQLALSTPAAPAAAAPTPTTAAPTSVTATAPTPAAVAAPSTPVAPSTSVTPPKPDRWSPLLYPFLEKSSTRSALLMNRKGELISLAGEPLEDVDTLASYFKFLASASGMLSDRLAMQALQGLLLEFGHQSILISLISDRLLLVLVLKDASALSLTRYLLRKQLPLLEEALTVKP